MNLNEKEMRMVYQIESTNHVATLNEIATIWRYAPKQETKDTAESLLKRLRPLSDKECMALIRDVQKNYRLPEKARTIGELLAEARQKSGAEKLTGHDMIVLDVLSHESPMGYKGDKMRLFLTEQGYQKAPDTGLCYQGAYPQSQRVAHGYSVHHTGTPCTAFTWTGKGGTGCSDHCLRDF